MLSTDKRKYIDLLVEQFWRNGYLTVSRKFGTYLPEPSKVGGFDIDIIAKQKKRYAIGITLSDEDFKNSKLAEKIIFLSTRQTKYTNNKVMLFIGVPANLVKNAKALVDSFTEDVRKNIRIFEIVERSVSRRRDNKKNQAVLFS
jgi:hypothetical protein